GACRLDLGVLRLQLFAPARQFRDLQLRAQFARAGGAGLRLGAAVVELGLRDAAGRELRAIALVLRRGAAGLGFGLRQLRANDLDLLGALAAVQVKALRVRSVKPGACLAPRLGFRRSV